MQYRKMISIVCSITHHASIIRDTNGNPSSGPSGYTECHIVSLHNVNGLVVSTLCRKISNALGWRGGPQGEEEEWGVSGKENERERKGDKIGGGCIRGRNSWTKELCKDNMVEGGQWRIKMKHIEGFIVNVWMPFNHQDIS